LFVEVFSRRETPLRVGLRLLGLGEVAAGKYGWGKSWIDSEGLSKGLILVFLDEVLLHRTLNSRRRY